MRAILAFLLSVLTAAHASWGRPYCSAQQFWTNTTCNNPAIIVSGDVTDVIFDGVNIQMTAAPSVPGAANIYVQCTSAANLGNILVSGPGSVSVVLVLQEPNIFNVASIEKASNITLSVTGRIRGNLGPVVASYLGRTPNTFGLVVDGDLTGDLDIQDTPGAGDLRIDDLVVRGDIAPGVTIDTNFGGIGDLRVDGTIGSASNPVTILSGLDISLIQAGEMHANIDVKHLDENDVEVWGNIRRVAR